MFLSKSLRGWGFGFDQIQTQGSPRICRHLSMSCQSRILLLRKKLGHMALQQEPSKKWNLSWTRSTSRTRPWVLLWCCRWQPDSVNAVENVHGYSPFQCAYGQAFRWTDEDVSTHLTLQPSSPTEEFQRLLALRHQAEQLARQSRAEGVLSKLKNPCPRQPIREFSPTTLVKVWRKALPHETHKGRRSGFAESAKPQWIGPGRVLFQELLPGQEDPDWRHVVWVVKSTCPMN